MSKQYSVNLQHLPLGMYTIYWRWLYENNIGNMREAAIRTNGEVTTVVMSEEEYTLLTLKFS